MGIVLIAIGGEGYLRWAVNMAASLKTFAPNLQIQLLTSIDLLPSAIGISFFDIVEGLPNEAWQDEDGRIFPAKLKTSFIDYVEFEEFIYLDVDGCIIKDITPLFGLGDIVTDVQGVWSWGDGEFNHLKWAKPPVVYEHFGLKESDKLPAINSSFLLLKKSKVKDMFEVAHDLLMNNPLPYEKHWYIWGRRREHKVSQPDELYLNVAMAKLGMIPKNEVAILFRMINDKMEFTSLSEIKEKFYGIGLFGQLETNHRRMREMYNQCMKEVWNGFGTPYFDKCEVLSKTKFAII